MFRWTAPRGRAHVRLCRPAYYLEWHVRRSLAPMLFDEPDRGDVTRSAPHRWPRPHPHRQRSARPPANSSIPQRANHCRCTAPHPARRSRHADTKRCPPRRRSCRHTARYPNHCAAPGPRSDRGRAPGVDSESRTSLNQEPASTTSMPCAQNSVRFGLDESGVATNKGGVAIAAIMVRRVACRRRNSHAEERPHVEHHSVIAMTSGRAAGQRRKAASPRGVRR